MVWHAKRRESAMGSTNNRYTPEFKQRAVQLYQSRMPVTYAEVARELGVDPGTLSKWVALAGVSEAPSGEPENPFQLAEDNRRLKRENGILLRASAFFASRNP